LRTSGNALIEAGTGTGKSLGYLCPSILAVLKRGGKVVVSTDTIQLQEQLIKKDLPFLESALGRPILFAIAKGRSNYFCPRNASSFLQEFGPAYPAGVRSVINECLTDFRNGAWNGDKSTLTVPVADNIWPEMCGDDTCEGKGCKQARGCPLMAAKDALETADIIVTNHTLYLLHHFVLSRTGQQGAPAGTLHLDRGRSAHPAGEVSGRVRGGHLAVQGPRLGEAADEAGPRAGPGPGRHRPEGAGEPPTPPFFQAFHGAQKDEQLISDFPEPILEMARERAEKLIAVIKPVQVQLDRAQAAIGMGDLERRWAVAALADSAKLLIDSIRAVLKPEQNENDVCFTQLSKGRQGERIATLHRKPAETSGIFRGVILPNLDSALFCSATLATGQGANAWLTPADEFGLELSDTATMQVESPFDYARQVTGYLSPFVPDAKHPEYHTYLAREVKRLLDHTKGRAFVLFTSTRDMQRCYDLLSAQTRYPLILQGTRPKDQLIREFKETPNAVLLRALRPSGPAWTSPAKTCPASSSPSCPSRHRPP
jgi:ATP-dependent DNA helicase DinG